MTDLATSYAFCRRVARTRARNFYYSFLLLSREQRDAMCAIYAFMRYCDDISEGAGRIPRGHRPLAAEIWIEPWPVSTGTIHCGRRSMPRCSAIRFPASIFMR